MRFLPLALLALSAPAVAQTIMPIPAFTRTFSAATTRGFWFTSPGPIVITTLNVPDETMNGIQNVELMRLASVPPAFPGTITGTQLFYAANAVAGTPITLPSPVVVNAGDIIGVLGACGTGTMANSYGSTGTFVSSLLGMPVNIERLLTQTNINATGGNQPVSAEPAGNISRVEIGYVPASGLFPGFSSDVNAGLAPLTVNFTDSSFTSDPAGILAWQWDLDGDGTIDSSLQNPTYTYTTQGVYDVTLNVIDGVHGLGTLTKTALIDVTLAAPSLQAVAEIAPGAGTLSAQSPQVFSDGWDIRWNLLDTTGTQTGMFGAVVANFGVGSSPPLGVTGTIPGFTQLWGASTPSGVAEVLGPFVVGGPDVAVTIPPGLFTPGDTVRFQGLMLDAQAGVGGLLPVVPTLETIEFRHRGCAGGFEDFDSLATGVGIYPAGWSNGGGGAEWSVIGGPTTSAATGPAAAVSGANYMYCETSVPVTGRTFIMNTPIIPTGGLNGTLNFELSRVGATIGTLEIRQDDGSGTFPILLATYTGADPTGADWTNESVNLQLAGLSTVQLQFNYAQGASFTGDLGIDDVCIN